MAYDPENNPYIPGDPASYDLSWVVERLNEHKFAEESAAEAKAYAEAAEGSASDASGYADDAEGYKNDAANTAATLAGMESAVNTQAQQIEVIEARMNSFTNLAEGSTTGDAELIDARIAYDGITYPSAGDAIRAQAAKLKYTSAIPRRWWYWQYRINPSGHTSYQSNTANMTSNFLYCQSGLRIHVSDPATYKCKVIKRGSATVSNYISNKMIDTEDFVCEIGYYYQLVLYRQDNTAIQEGDDTTIVLYCDDIQYTYWKGFSGIAYHPNRDILALTDFYRIVNADIYNVTTLNRQLSYSGSPIGYLTSTSNNSGMASALSFKLDYDAVIVNMHDTATLRILDPVNNTLLASLAPAGGSLTISAGTEWYWYRTYVADYSNNFDKICVRKADIDYTPSSSQQLVNFDLSRRFVKVFDYAPGMTGFNTGNGTQDADQYGNYLVMYTSVDHTFYVQDLTTHSLIQSTALTYEEAGHGNSLCFTDQFYDASDPLPLVLCADWYNAVIHVIRFNSSFAASHIRDISVTCDGTGYIGFAYDKWAKILYAVRWNSSSPRTGLLISSISREFDFTADTSYTFPASYYVPLNGMILQGLCAFRGYIFMAVNNSDYSSAYVYVVDDSKQQICDIISTLTTRFSGYEIEGIWMDPDIIQNSGYQNIYIMRYTSRIGIITQFNEQPI